MNRRGFLGSILALGTAPAIVQASSIMRIKPLLLPAEDFIFTYEGSFLNVKLITEEALRSLYNDQKFFRLLDSGKAFDTIKIRVPQA